jgi:hypothetical protein
MIRISFECVSAMMARGSTQRSLTTAANLDIGAYRGCASGLSELDRDLDFWNEMGAGTEVQLAIPAAMAYEKRPHNRRFPAVPPGRQR